jgi:hypothetical protein
MSGKMLWLLLLAGGLLLLRSKPASAAGSNDTPLPTPAPGNNNPTPKPAPEPGTIPGTAPAPSPISVHQIEFSGKLVAQTVTLSIRNSSWDMAAKNSSDKPANYVHLVPVISITLLRDIPATVYTPVISKGVKQLNIMGFSDDDIALPEIGKQSVVSFDLKDAFIEGINYPVRLDDLAHGGYINPSEAAYVAVKITGNFELFNGTSYKAPTRKPTSNLGLTISS